MLWYGMQLNVSEQMICTLSQRFLLRQLYLNREIEMYELSVFSLFFQQKKLHDTVYITCLCSSSRTPPLFQAVSINFRKTGDNINIDTKNWIWVYIQ